MERFYIPIDWIVDLYEKKIIYSFDLFEIGEIVFHEIKGNLSKCLSFLDENGWGSFKIVAYSPNYIIISGKSTFAKLALKYYGIHKEPVDFFIIGFLNAWAKYNGLNIKFEEVECIAKGNEKCIFVGKPLESE